MKNIMFIFIATTLLHSGILISQTEELPTGQFMFGVKPEFLGISGGTFGYKTANDLQISIPCMSNAQSFSIPDSVKVHDIIMQGIDSLYSFKFKGAEARFNEVIKTVPKDPRGYFFKAMIYYYRYLIMGMKTEYDKFMSLSDTVINVGKEVLKRDKKNSNAMFYLGGIYGYRGIMALDKGSIMKAVWDGKKGYSYLEDAIEADPNNYDARMGLGLYDYLLSDIPRAFRWVVSLIGFNPDSERGLQQLEQAAAKGVYAQNEAKWWLSFFYSNNNKSDKRFQLIKEFYMKYPLNPIYGLAYGIILLNEHRQVDDAIEVFKKTISVENPEAEKWRSNAFNILCFSYFYKNEFKEAIEWFEKYIEAGTADTARQSKAKYMIGLCYEMTGNRPSAEKYYNQVSYLDDAKKRLMKPMDDYDKVFQKMSNHFNASKYDDGETLANELLTQQDLNDDKRGNILFELGEAYYYKKDYQKAEVELVKVINLQIKELTWLKPKAQYRLGHVYLNQKQKDKARIAFKKVLEYKKYDGEKDLREGAENQIDNLED